MYEMCFFVRIFRSLFSRSHLVSCILFFLTIQKLCDVGIRSIWYLWWIRFTIEKYNRIFFFNWKENVVFENVPKKNMGNATFRCYVYDIDALTRLFPICSHAIKFSLSLHIIHDWFEMVAALIKKRTLFFTQ